MSSCLMWKKSETVPADGDDIKMEEEAEVGVLWMAEWPARGIILPSFSL